MNTQDFVTKPVRGIFFRYLIPSICGTMVTSIYVLADTIMIGKGLGATAMAALNIALPIYNIFFGIGLLFGVGGSVLMSVCRGRGDKKKADAFFTLSFILNIVIWLLSQIVCVVWMEEIAWALGATKETFPYVMDYMRCIIWGMGAYYLSSYLQTFVRNDGAPKLAMNAVIAGGVTNIVLDYLFVFPMQMGMAGAALATVLGSTLTVVILVLHFFSPKNQLRFQIHGMSISAVREILVNGAASFVIEISSGITIYIFNLQLLKYVGNTAVAVFGIICNVSIVIMSLCKGVNQAAQPIISTNFGAGKGERIHQVFWSAVLDIVGHLCSSGSGGNRVPGSLYLYFLKSGSADSGVVSIGNSYLFCRLYSNGRQYGIYQLFSGGGKAGRVPDYLYAQGMRAFDCAGLSASFVPWSYRDLAGISGS